MHLLLESVIVYRQVFTYHLFMKTLEVHFKFCRFKDVPLFFYQDGVKCYLKGFSILTRPFIYLFTLKRFFSLLLSCYHSMGLI